MNENMNGQIPVEPVVQQPVMNQPVMQNQQQPMMNPQPAMHQQPVMPQQQQPVQPSANANGFKDKLNNMDKDKVLKISGIVCGVLMIISLFMPFLKVSILGYTSTLNLWESAAGYDMFKFFVILCGLLAIGVFFLQKAKTLSYISGGVALGFIISIKDNMGSDGYTLGLGFWALLLGGLGIIVINIIENLDEVKSIFMKPATVIPGQPVVAPNSVPQTMATVTPVVPVAPIVQNVTVCSNCGQPKKNQLDQFCQSCGQRY